MKEENLEYSIGDYIFNIKDRGRYKVVDKAGSKKENKWYYKLKDSNGHEEIKRLKEDNYREITEFIYNIDHITWWDRYNKYTKTNYRQVRK